MVQLIRYSFMVTEVNVALIQSDVAQSHTEHSHKKDFRRLP